LSHSNEEKLTAMGNKLWKTVTGIIYNAKYYTSSDVTHQERPSVTLHLVPTNYLIAEFRNYFYKIRSSWRTHRKGFSQKAQPVLHTEALNLFDGRGRRRENEPNLKSAYRGLLTNVLRKNPKAYCCEMSQNFRLWQVMFWE